MRKSTPWDDRRRARRVAKQIIKIGKIFENELGITVASRSKIRPVFAWQIGGWLPWYDDVLSWINTTYGAPKNFIFGIASAPYFGEGYVKSNATPQEVAQGMTASSDSNVVSIKYLAELANQWQMKHLQYEGGPDNGGGSTVNIKNRIRANRIQEMKQLVIHNYKDNWFSANGKAPVGTNDLANYFVMSGKSSRYGCWGATEDLRFLKDLSKAPKYDALCQLTGMCGNEPVVSLTQPNDLSIAFVQSPLTITAEASDLDGKVEKVEFFVGSTLIGIDSAAPFSFTWTPVQTGIFTLAAKAIDNHEKYTFSSTRHVTVENRTGHISKLPRPLNFNVFPVPANQSIHIHFEQAFLDGSLEIRDIFGKTFFHQKLQDETLSIAVNEWKNGVYFIILENIEGRVVQKIMIYH